MEPRLTTNQPEKDPDMKEFLFDAKIFATFRIQAQSEKEARAILADKLDGAEANFGAWDNGDPILSTVSIDGPADLIEEGEA